MDVFRIVWRGSVQVNFDSKTPIVKLKYGFLGMKTLHPELLCDACSAVCVKAMMVLQKLAVSQSSLLKRRVIFVKVK